MTYIATAMQDVRINGEGDFDAQENRMPEFGLIAATIAMTSGNNPLLSAAKIAQLKASYGRPANIAVTNVNNMATTTARSCAFATGEGTSALVAVTFGTIATSFTIVPTQFASNELAFSTELARQFKNAQKALGLAYEALIHTALNASKSQIYDSGLVGVGADYPLVGDALQVSTVLREDFFNDGKSIMKGDDFEGPYHVIGSTELASDVRKFDAQGSGNSTNLGYQFAGYFFNYSKRIPVTAGSRSTGYMMPDGSLSHVIRLTPDQEAGTKNTDTEWGKIFAEELGFEIGLIEKEQCADVSASTGIAEDTAVNQLSIEASMSYTIMVPYNSSIATLPGGIKKFDILA